MSERPNTEGERSGVEATESDAGATQSDAGVDTESGRSVLRTVQSVLLLVAAGGLVATTYFWVEVEPATGFETSLTGAFPPEFWVAFYGVLVCSVVVLLCSLVDRSGYWRHATALVLADYLLFFFLPLARGYRLYGRGSSDILVHVGDVLGILQTGTLAAGSWYPMQHTFVTELVLFGFPLQGAEYVVAYTYTAVYVASMGYLVRTMTDSREATAAGLVAASPLVFSIFHTTIIPSFLSLLLFPTLLAIMEVYRRTKSPTYLALFLVFGVGIVFFHPVTAGFLVVLILSTTAFGYVYQWLTGRRVRKLSPTLAFIVAPATYVWYINFRETRSSIEQIAEAWLSGGSTPGEAAGDAAAEAPLSLVELATRFVELYGMVFVYVAVAGLFALAVLYAAYTRRLRYEEAYATAQFGVGFCIAVTFFAVYLIEFEPIRVARYMIVMAVFLVALAFVRTGEWRPRRRHAAVALLGVGVVAAAVLGANAAYWPNEQLTDAEYEGSAFVLSNTQKEVPIRTYAISHKMEWYVRGSVHPDLWPPNIETGLPKGLGYNDTQRTAAAIYGQTYLVTQDFDREYYTDSYFTADQQRELLVYDQEDIYRMNRDPTVVRLYDNGGFEAWYVRERPRPSEGGNGTVAAAGGS